MRFARSLGYLGVTITWFIVFALTVAVAFCFWVVPPEPISTQQGILDKLQDPKDWVSGLVLVYLILPWVWGFVHLLVLMALGPLLLAALAFWRSLKPGYAHEKLTGSVLRSDAAGISPSGVAISLLPKRHTPYSLWVTRLNARAWLLDGSWYLGLAWLGFAHFLLLGWLRWPIHNPFLIALSIVLALGFVVLAVRRLPVGWRRLRLDAVDGETPVLVNGAEA
jgi:hypothetical protein